VGQRADDLNLPRLYPSETDVEFEENTATAREDIEFTRAEMSTTIDAIQDRLDPEVLSEEAKATAHDVTDYAVREAKEAAREITDHAIAQAREAVQDITGQAKAALRDATIGKVETMARTASDTAGGWRQSVLETIKANPMPAALVGLGLGWMLLNRPNGSAESSRYMNPAGFRAGAGYAPPTYGASAYGGVGVSGAGGGAQDRAGPKVSQMADQAQQSAGQLVDQVQQTGSQVIDQIQQTGGQVVDQVQQTGGQVIDEVQEKASVAQGFLEHQLEENPLLVGAVAVAIGGVLAGTIRSTRREDQLLGSTRDRLVGSASELTQDTMQKVGRVMDEVQSTATERAKQESLLPESAGQ
jgi:hypothetical protein